MYLILPDTKYKKISGIFVLKKIGTEVRIFNFFGLIFRLINYTFITLTRNYIIRHLKFELIYLKTENFRAGLFFGGEIFNRPKFGAVICRFQIAKMFEVVG